MARIILFLIISFPGIPAFAQSSQDMPVNISQFEFAYPFWSPDGKKIVFQSNFSGNWQLYEMDTATKEIKRLMNNKFNDVTPAWSPDGSKILFTSDRDGDEEIFVLHIKTGVVTQLTKNESRDIHPNWSPDGKNIILNSDRKEDKPKKLFIQTMDADGGNLKILKEEESILSYASFSPDGKKIAFLKWMEKGNNGEIFCINADGTGEERLTNNTVWDAWPAWSANGDKVVYSSQIDGKFKLCSVDIVTKKITQLSFGNDEDARANFSKDGKSIVFNRGESGKIDILILKMQE